MLPGWFVTKRRRIASGEQFLFGWFGGLVFVYGRECLVYLFSVYRLAELFNFLACAKSAVAAKVAQIVSMISSQARSGIMVRKFYSFLSSKSWVPNINLQNKFTEICEKKKIPLADAGELVGRYYTNHDSRVRQVLLHMEIITTILWIFSQWLKMGFCCMWKQKQHAH